MPPTEVRAEAAKKKAALAEQVAALESSGCTEAAELVKGEISKAERQAQPGPVADRLAKNKEYLERCTRRMEQRRSDLERCRMQLADLEHAHNEIATELESGLAENERLQRELAAARREGPVTTADPGLQASSPSFA